MKQGIRQFAQISKSVLFTLAVHSILLAAVLAGFWWPFSEKTLDHGQVKPIQATTIPEQEVTNLQTKKIEEQHQPAQVPEEPGKAEEEERKRLEALEAKRREEERKRAEEERKRLEALEAKRKEEERKRAEEEERKRLEALEAKRKEEEEQRKLEKELQDQLARTRTRNEAENALAALVDRIAAAAENNWRRPWNSTPGRVALIRVRVARNGDVLSADVVKSSGDRAFDESGEIAIKKASPLPFPSESEYYEFIKEFNIKFAPDE